MKKRMLSRLMAVVCVAALALGLTACGSDKKEVESTAKTFMTYCDDGDFTSAQKMCSSSASTSLDIDENMEDTFKKGFYSSFSSMGISESDLSQSAQDSVNDLMKYYKKNLIKSYTINDDYDDNDKSLSVKVSILDPNSMNSSTFTNSVSTLSQNYFAQHQSELMSAYSSGGEKGLYVALFNGIMPEAIEKAKSQMIDTASTKDYTWKLTFEKDGGDWKVKSAKETKAN